MSRLLLLMLIVNLLTGCSFFGDDGYESEAPRIAETVRSLPEVTQAEVPMEAVSLEDLVQQLSKIETTDYQYEVSNRLAQLRLALMEEQLADGEAEYDAPMQALQQLKTLTDNDEDRALVDYQLARVLSLSGAQTARSDAVLAALSETIEHTDSDAVSLESRFRRAEMYFSSNEISLAEQDFSVVAAAPGEYQLHAGYLLSWVRFKLAELDGSLHAATATLAAMETPDDHNLDELREDLLRVMVLALNDADGPETLANLMDDAGKPAWQTDVYRALGDWYLEKDRFADSARTWQTFLAENPLNAAAPSIALEVIKTQREAGFVSDIPGLEQDFIARYGKQTAFYELHRDEVFATYEAPLRGMLDRYTQRRHALAQEATRQQDYLLAAEAYELWLINFDTTEDAQEQRFLYAEVLETATGFLSALPQYEMVLSMAPNTTFGREAAYATVLGMSRDVAGFGVNALIEVNLRFAHWYPDDARSPACQLTAATHLFDQQQYALAIEAATTAEALSDESDYQLVVKRLLAHSRFELGEFALAESHYRELLTLGEPTLHQLLAAVFRQGEEAELNGELESAVIHYQRLRDIAPDTDLARDTTFDVAALYEQLDQPDLAIAQLELYRDRYPPMTEREANEISSRLVDLRESEEDLVGAASELIALSERTIGDETRVARYRAAELFLQAGQLDQAITHFRYYAHNFSEPVDIRFEAMHHMDELYQKTGEIDKRRYWLRKKRDLFASLQLDDRTDRAKHLAAHAMFELGEKDFLTFQSATLTLPLARSLQKKQNLLSRSLATYQAIVDVGAFDYVTRSYFRMAKLYETLATDLMASEVPRGLNVLEQEQYEILLEEQAYPFEEKAISLHQENLALGWQLGWNESVNDSLLALQRLSPARFTRPVQEVAYVHAAH